MIEEKLSSAEYQRQYRARKRAEKQAMAAASVKPPVKSKKSLVNQATEYGALFNRMNEERDKMGLPPLKTAMETLIEAMQSEELDIQQKARIAEKIASYESSRAPIISIEHVQNVQKEDELDADMALAEFLEAIKKS